eukprot:CAMPEP_0194164434 /NCGR_PEP_ID=MMETSP0154-20130528/546_1 /TAXON_ID=1049557 /ORGANISM="Thalassiothrix antarctica, Strain L6-D1" /LENGTH=295 /DNA_ID=CAMNT_0038874615 /DNA_START=150 /DNA_END=1037 /DNA_ORIENTATION=+
MCKTTKGQTFAHAEFKTPEDAKNAVSDRSIKIHGCSVHCKYDVGAADGHKCKTPATTTPQKRKREEKNEGEEEEYYIGEYPKELDNDTRKKKCSLEHTVILGGLPFDGTEKDVQDLFKAYKDDILEVYLPKRLSSVRLKGYGHIVFNSVASVKKAIAMSNKKNIGKRYITIKECYNGKKNNIDESQITAKEDCKTITVKCVPYHATNKEVRDAFKVCGKISKGNNAIRIERNTKTHISKGTAIVEFKTYESANEAIRRNGEIKIHGRHTICQYYEEDKEDGENTTPNKKPKLSSD